MGKHRVPRRLPMCSKRFLSVALLSFAGCTFNAPVDVDIHDPNILLNAEGTIGPPQVDVHIETIGGPPGVSIPVVEDDSIVLVAGIHVGTIEITENNVFLAGEVDEDGNLLTTIDGDLIIQGNNVTVRGLIVTGAVIIRGNNAILGF